MIMVNLHSCYMNPDEWDNPEEFCPERFLGADSSTFINTEKMNFIYGAGKVIHIFIVYLYVIAKPFCPNHLN